MVVAVVGVVDVWVDATFKDRGEALGFDERKAKKSGEEDGIEGGEMANVEERLMAEVDGLLVQH